MPRLRGHHLICLHFYDGAGYDEPFIRNLEEILDEVRKEGVTVGQGPDDVCDPCPHRTGKFCTFSRSADREIRNMDERALELLDLPVGRKVGWIHVRETVTDLFPGWYGAYCFACSWRPACDKNNLFQILAGRTKQT